MNSTYLPITLKDIAGYVRDNGDRQVRNIGRIDTSTFDPICDDSITGAVVGILPDPAWAEHFAIANF